MHSDPALVANAYRDEQIPYADDPPNVTEFQRHLENEFDTRWRTVRGDLRTTIDRNDALGLASQSGLGRSRRALGYRGTSRQFRPESFTGSTLSERREQFDDWLEYVLEQRVLSPLTATRRRDGEHYSADPIRRAYFRGAIRASNFLRASGSRPDIDLPGATELLSDSRHVARLESLYSDMYHDVKVAIRAVERDVIRKLSRHLRDGTAIRALADTLTTRVDAVGQTRTQTATRVRTIEAANLAALVVYADAGVDRVRTMVGFDPTDADACERCLSVARTAYTIEDIENGTAPLVPLDTHPGSKSFYVPV